MAQKIALVLAATLSPISELRGGIPLGISLGLDPVLTFIIAVIANALLFFPIFLLLRLFYDKLLSRIELFSRYLAGVRRRGEPIVTKYGFTGLTLFVAVPLPLMGVYTATILAWLLDMNWRKAFPAVSLGALAAGIIVLLITMGVIQGWKFFTVG